MDKLVTDIVHEAIKQKENLILDQLTELVSRGLLVVEQTNPTLTRTYNHSSQQHEVKLAQCIKLKLKDQEYIERLEAENKEYKEIIDTLKRVVV